jgi:hypothetical protein
MISPLNRVFQPWESKPFELISWRDMLQFSANAFFWAGRALRGIREDCYIACARCVDGQVLFATPTDLDVAAREKAMSSLPHVQEEFERIGLSIFAETAKELQESLSKTAVRRSFQWLHDQVEVVEKIAEKELRGKFFLYIPPERARFWPNTGQPNVFGETVADKFPSTSFDVANSGVCLATMMSTAAVFHLMRVMEIGLAALGKVFGVSAAFANWEVILNQIESKIAGMRSDPAWKTLPDCKEQQEFYSQAASHFRTVKDAWRNYTMHSRAKYTEEEAEQIFNAVRGFMQKLAEKLSE